MDASAVLAYLWKEPGWEAVEKHLLADEAIISTVNVTEVACKILEKGFAEQQARLVIRNLGMVEVEFDSQQAWRAAELRASTRAWGLSLGDRACLALAQDRDIVAVTADRSWLETKIGVSIELIR
jgi:ribonuclease VapC